MDATIVYQADDEAYASQLAFALGKFDEHFAAKVASIRQTMEAEYAEFQLRNGDSGERAGSGGLSSGSESGRLGGPP